MRRTLVGLIAALALGSVSPAAFAADIAAAGAGGELDRLLSRRRWWRRLGRSRHQSQALRHSTMMGPAIRMFDFHRDFNELSDGNIVGIVQGGFDWELGGSAFVIGLGADATFGDVLSVDRNNDDTVFDLHNRFHTDGSTMVDVYGRAGFAVTPNLLVFGLVGWSCLDINTDFRIRDIETDETIFHHSDNRSADGLTFGGGVEWKVTDNVSIRGDYRFTDLNNFSNDGNFHCDVCEDTRLPEPQRRECQRPARAVHPQLALWWVR